MRDSHPAGGEPLLDLHSHSLAQRGELTPPDTLLTGSRSLPAQISTVKESRRHAANQEPSSPRRTGLQLTRSILTQLSSLEGVPWQQG